LIFGHRSGVKRSEQVEWVFARDLLATGIFEPAGMGDVRMGPIDEASEMAALTLIGGDSQATLLVAKMAVSEFLELTYGLCAQGDESQYISPHA